METRRFHEAERRALAVEARQQRTLTGAFAQPQGDLAGDGGLAQILAGRPLAIYTPTLRVPT
jgi:hypothetical protein